MRSINQKSFRTINTHFYIINKLLLCFQILSCLQVCSTFHWCRNNNNILNIGNLMVFPPSAVSSFLFFCQNPYLKNKKTKTHIVIGRGSIERTNERGESDFHSFIPWAIRQLFERRLMNKKTEKQFNPIIFLGHQTIVTLVINITTLLDQMLFNSTWNVNAYLKIGFFSVANNCNQIDFSFTHLCLFRRLLWFLVLVFLLCNLEVQCNCMLSHRVTEF